MLAKKNTMKNVYENFGERNNNNLYTKNFEPKKSQDYKKSSSKYILEKTDAHTLIMPTLEKKTITTSVAFRFILCVHTDFG